MAQLNAFIIYSSEDVKFKKELLKYLFVLKDKLNIWDDSQIPHGDQWQEIIIRNLNNADIIFYLVSAESLVSEFINTVEIPIAIERRNKGKVRLIPIIIKPCLWPAVPAIEKVQVIPKKEGLGFLAISRWESQEDAWTFTATEITNIIEDILAWRQSSLKNSVNAYNNYLKFFKKGYYISEAQSRKYQILESELKAASNSDIALQAFIRNYKDETVYVDRANNTIRRLQQEKERNDYDKAMQIGTVSELERFKKKYSRSNYTEEITKRINAIREEEEFQWANAKRTGTVASVKFYISKYPNSTYINDAKRLLVNVISIQEDNDFWQSIEKTSTISKYEEYLKKFTNGKFRHEAQGRLTVLYQAEPIDWGKAISITQNNENIKKNLEVYYEFIEKYPNGKFYLKAQEKINQIDDQHWKNLFNLRSPISIYKYIQVLPKGKHVKKAKASLLLLGSACLIFTFLLAKAWAFFAKAKSGTDLDNFVLVEGGPFYNNDNHKDSVGSFYMSKYEMTYGDLRKLTKVNRTDVSNEYPLDGVSQENAQLIINLLLDKYHIKFRLPTEKEWEYAARGGKMQFKTKYSGFDDIQAVGWYQGNSNHIPHVVGQLKPNALGLYDMTGNVFELCRNDLFNGRAGENFWMWRGGACDSDTSQCHITFRVLNTNNRNKEKRGLRLVTDKK